MAAELDDNPGLSRSETGSTISMSSLEVSDKRLNLFLIFKIYK
jgi:hypothetical protein